MVRDKQLLRIWNLLFRLKPLEQNHYFCKCKHHLFTGFHKNHGHTNHPYSRLTNN